MKKKFAVYGLQDGRMVLHFKCSSMNLCASSISACVRGNSLPGSVSGAPG